MLHPHRTGRIPVVLVHGTASSPARWAELINELENDPRFWEHYEIWLFIYNTGNPIAYSGMLLRDALIKAVADLDPEGKDPGLEEDGRYRTQPGRLAHEDDGHRYRHASLAF